MNSWAPLPLEHTSPGDAEEEAAGRIKGAVEELSL